MDAGLVTALSGAMAQSKRVEVIANNLANTDTPGFKADDLTFEEQLMGAHNKDQRSDIPEQPPKDSELFSQSGDERRVVLYGRDYTNMRMGALKQTDNPLDVAIDGNGFLEVLTPNGTRLTRAGNLALDPQGRLVNRDGFLVLGPGQTARAPASNTATASLNPESSVPTPPTPPTNSEIAQAAARAITVGNGGGLHIDLEGNVYTTNNHEQALVGRLGVVQVENPAALVKDGNNLFRARPEAFVKPAPLARAPAGAIGAAPAPSEPPKPNQLGSASVAPRVHQGMLESSNVNPIQEMTSLIEAHRLFDQNTKLMQTQGDAAGRLSDIGRF